MPKEKVKRTKKKAQDNRKRKGKGGSELNRMEVKKVKNRCRGKESYRKGKENGGRLKSEGREGKINRC